MAQIVPAGAMEGMNKSLRSSWMTVIVAGVFLGGCAAKVPLMQDSFDLEGERFQPAPGRANIYVVREDAFMGSAIVFQVMVDGRVKGTVGPGTYLLFDVEPGAHSIAVITQESADSKRVNAAVGRNYFLEIKPEMGWVAARASVEQIDGTRGQQLVIDGKRAEPLLLD